MKLTSEGAARLGRHESRGFPIGDFEFNPKDFEGMVCLTADEARCLHSIVMDSAHDHGVTQEEFDVFYKFTKCVEQAEKP